MEIEFQVLDFIQGLRTPFADRFMSAITTLGDNGIIWIVLTGILLLIPKKRYVGVTLMVALILDLLICNVIMKNLIARTRPFDINTSIELLIAIPKDFSFPSGHTAASVVATVVLYFRKQKILWMVAALLTLFIAFSRMYLYVHFPSDILGGAIIGAVIGYLGYRIVYMFEIKYGRKTINKN